MTFLGRTRELKVLQEAWNSKGSAFIPIYGRRRVGKSERAISSPTRGEDKGGALDRKVRHQSPFKYSA